MIEKKASVFAWVGVVVGTSLAFGCASAADEDPVGTGPNGPGTTPPPAVGGSPSQPPPATGGSGEPAGGGGSPSTGGGGAGDFAPLSNPFEADWASLVNQASDPDNLNQCVGFEDDAKTIYRTYDPSDINANPKEGETCGGVGNTDGADGRCNVPCGLERLGAPVGNKLCTCAGGIFNDCGCAPLPEAVFTPPTQACDAIWDGFDSAATDATSGEALSFAKQMDEVACTTEWDTCITPDIPFDCSYTTPRGCACLPDSGSKLVWQCGSTNSWFSCTGESCPAAYAGAGIVGGDIKGWCASGGNL